MKTWTFDSPDAEQTLESGAELGRSIGARGLAIALVGPLGAGKTVFVKGLATGLGVDPRVISSPTFVIAQQYALSSGPERLHHVDLYRLESSVELETIGFYDMLTEGQVVAVEWADRFPDVLGREFLSIEFEGPSPQEEDAARSGSPWRGRRARVTAHGADAESVLEDWARRVERASRSSAGQAVASLEMRVLSILLLMLGLLVFGRMDWERDLPICEVLVPEDSADSDGLGTLHAHCVSAETGVHGGLTGIARLLDGDSIDLNRASALLLQTLPGVGPVRAAAIVGERERAAFAAVADLERVVGIGPKTRTKIEAWVSVAERREHSPMLRRGDFGDG